MERAGRSNRSRHYSLTRAAASPDPFESDVAAETGKPDCLRRPAQGGPRARSRFASRARTALLLGALFFAGLHCPAADVADETRAVEAASAADSPPSARLESAAGTAPAVPAVPAVPAADAAPTTGDPARPAIVFLGTSLTAGYGLPESEAYPALLGQRLAAAGLDYQVVNAGVSGDTSAGGLRRLDWLLRLPIAVLVVELGANDMLRGQSVEALEANLVALCERARAAYPELRIVIAGMRAAPNLGREYATAFDAVYPRLADRFGAALVPFLLEDVVARPELNQADGIHPTAEGHERIADRLWSTLEPVARAALR